MISRSRALPRSVIAWLLGSLVFVLFWALASRVVGAEIILPGPLETVRRFLISVRTGAFYRHLGGTWVRAMGGFGIAYATGVFWGLLAGLEPVIDDVLKPSLVAMRATPVIAVILLAIIWFEAALAPVFVTVLMVLPVVVQSVTAGVRASAPPLLEMATVFSVSRARVIRGIVLPSAAPALSSSAHAGLGMAFKVTVAAEVLVQPPWALGSQMQEARFFLDTPRILSLTLSVILLSAVSEAVLQLVERLVRRRPGTPAPGARSPVVRGAALTDGGPAAGQSDLPAITRPQTLALRDLSIVREQRTVVASVNLHVEPGSVVAMFGPSGCGKSSILHAVCGLLPNAAGSIEPADASLVSIAFQDSRLLPSATALENLDFVHASREKSDAGSLRRDHTTLSACGLSGRENDDTRIFSGGMMQRVNLARAVATVRSILLLDEPLQSLDLGSTMRLAGYLRTLTRRQGRATLAVTHDVTEALLLADTVVVLAGSPASVVATVPVPFADADRDPRAVDFQRAAADLYSLLLESNQA